MFFNEYLKRKNLHEDLLKRTLKQDSIILIGNSIGTFPIELLTDKNISGDTFKLWSYLRCLSNDTQVQQIPNQVELAKLMNVSRPTLIKAIQLLRLKRWLVVTHQFNNNLKTASLYQITDNQLDLETIIQIDQNYLQFVAKLANKESGATNMITTVAQQIFEELHPETRNQLKLSLDLFEQKKAIRTQKTNKKTQRTQKAVSDRNNETNTKEELSDKGNKKIEHLVYESLVKIIETRLGFYDKQQITKKLKSKNHSVYINKDEKESFHYSLNYADMNIILTALIVDQPERIFPYLNKLIYLASNNELIMQAKQRSFYNQILRDLNNKEEEANLKALSIESENIESLVKATSYRATQKAVVNIPKCFNSLGTITLQENEVFALNEFDIFRSTQRVMVSFEKDIAGYLIQKNFLEAIKTAEVINEN